MINELIKFCELISSEKDVSAASSEKEIKKIDETKRDKKLKPVIVIQSKEDKNNIIQFAKCELLKTDEEIVRFIDKIPDMQFQKDASYFRNWISKQNNLRNNNKRLGSTAGLLNSVPYVAILTEKNVSNFEGKVNKMSSSKTEWKTQGTWEDKKLQDRLTASLCQVYRDFWKNKPEDKFLDFWTANTKDEFIVIPTFVLFPEKISGLGRKEIYSAFENDRKNEWENEDNVSKDEMNCPVCGRSALLGTLRDATYQDKKPFLKRLDRPDMYGLRVCSDCESKYSEAIKLLSEKRFRIFPIFNDKLPVGMHLVNEDGYAKRFRDIFIEIREKTRTDRFDFKLVALSGGQIWLYDFITGYSPVFENASQHYTRFDVERDFWSLMDIENNYPYFEDAPKSLNRKSNRIRQFIYTNRQGVFDFIYRGDDSALRKQDVMLALDLRIKDALLNIGNSERVVYVCSDAIKKTFNILKVLKGDSMEISKEDQEKAMNFGKAFRRVVGLSEAKNEHNLLTLALDKPKVDGVKSVFARLLDKFRHNFKDLTPKEQKLISDCLTAKYSMDRFDLLKPYFYAGYFDVEVEK